MGEGISVIESVEGEAVTSRRLFFWDKTFLVGGNLVIEDGGIGEWPTVTRENCLMKAETCPARDGVWCTAQFLKVPRTLLPGQEIHCGGMYEEILESQEPII